MCVREPDLKSVYNEAVVENHHHDRDHAQFSQQR